MNRSLLMAISDKIEASELETMKNSCSDYGIRASRLEEINEAFELFDELRKLCLLTPNVVVKLLEKADRTDLKEMVLDTEAPLMEDSCATEHNLGVVPGTPVANGVLRNTHLNDISEDLGRDWKPLGRKLGLRSSILDNISQENHCVKDKAFKMLSRWRKKSGKDATAQILADALIAIGRTDVAEILAGLCQQDGIIIHIREENVNLDQGSTTDSGGLNSMQSDLAPALPL